MPQVGQIIPSYLQPHTMTVINDNTVFQEDQLPSVVVEELVRSAFVFVSAKGRDGVVLEKTNEPDFLEEYGIPNFKLHGQPIYNAHAFVSQDQTKGWCMRVMPPDATYSNLCIVAKVKVDTTIPATPRLIIRFEALQHNGIDSIEDFSAVTDLLTSTTPDVDGFRTYPLMTFYSLGRGVYGDGFRMRITGATQEDIATGFRNYRFEVLELENTISQKESFTGAVYPAAIKDKLSIYISDLILDPEAGSSKIGVYLVEDSFSAIYDIYKEQVRTNTTITEDQFSILTGLNSDLTTIDGVVFDTSNSAHVPLDAPEGIPLSGGNDGAFTYDVANLAARETAIDTAYSAAFRGTSNRTLLSKHRTPCDFILDAGYSDEVKRDLVALLTRRYDALGHIDGGILNTATDAITWGTSIASLSDRVFTKQFQHYKVRDPFSGRPIPVTITYYFAQNLARHILDNGIHTPFIGEAFAPLTGAIKNSLRPVIDADDLDLKEQFYKLRLNYFQAIAENTFVRGTQTTSQDVWSDLSEENNMGTLLEMKRMVEGLVDGLTYNFADADDRSEFTADANRLFADGYVGTKVETASVTFSMTKWEEERSIIHCYLNVVFRTLGKRSIVEIDINKRV